MNRVYRRFSNVLDEFRWIGALLIICFLSPEILAATPKSSGDCFFIPQYNNSIVVANQFGGDRWENANWFTFGTVGHPKVDVFGKYKLDGEGNVDSLFLAFHIRQDAVPHKFDMLTICIDPDNTGIPSLENVLIRCDIFPYPTLLMNFSECRGMNTAGEVWQPLTESDFIHTTTHWDNLYHTWRAEIFVDCNDLAWVANDSFGLYFQALDFINDDTFARYYWPVSAHAHVANPDYVPPATEWARGHFINSSSNILPDYYLDYWDLQVNNSESNFTIQLKEKNVFRTKIHNTFLDDSWNGGAVTGIVQFQVAEYGAACYSEHYDANKEIAPPGAPVDISVTRVGSGAGSKNITLRSDLTSAIDAISSNNSMVRNMQYIPAIEGKTFEIPVTISNCLPTQDYSSADDAKDLNQPVRSPLFASAAPMPPQDDREIFYLYLDQSGLDTTNAKDTWDIAFIPDHAGDDFPLPVADSLHRDLYKVLLRPGDFTKFRIQVKAPLYQWSSAKNLQFFQGFLQRRNQKEATASISRVNLALAESPKKLLPVLWQSRSHFLKLFPRGVVSDLQLNVFKHKDFAFKKGKPFYLIHDLNNFGAHIEVLPTPGKSLKFMNIIIVIVLLFVFYTCYKFWKKRKWDFSRVILSIILVIDFCLMCYVIWITWHFINL